MRSIVQDVRFALRQARHRPGSTATMVVVLGLGLGSTIALFTIVDQLLLRPLPGIAEPETLVQVGRTEDGEGFDTVSYPYFEALAESTDLLSHLVAFADFDTTVRTADRAERITVGMVSKGYFEALGPAMEAGRPLASSDGGRSPAPVAVLGSSLAKTLFGGAEEAIGRRIEVSDVALEVAGVVSQSFRGVETIQRIDLWAPLGMQPQVLPMGQDFLASRGSVWLEMFGRLAPGATPEAVEAELGAVAEALAAAFPEDYGSKGIAVAPGLGLSPDARRDLAAFHGRLMGLVVLVLLIACANVANLLLVRGTERRQELGIRVALGCGPSRLSRQLLTEALLLGLAGVGTGIAVALAAGDAMRLLVAASLGAASPLGPAAAEVLELAVDGRIVGFSILVALGTTVLFGLAPALWTARTATASSLRSSGGSSDRSSTTMRDLGIASQLALSVVLLVVAVLFLRSLGEYLEIDPGFDAERVAVTNLELGTERATQDKVLLVERILQSVESLPGVDGAALGLPVPLAGSRWSTRVPVPGGGGGAGDDFLDVDFRTVTPGYFETMGIRETAGRVFTDDDRPGSRQVIVVGKALARRLWPDRDPVGQTLRTGFIDDTTFEVVGVVEDMKYLELAESPRLHFYFPLAQRLDLPFFNQLVLHVRSDTGDPLALLPSVRQAVRTTDPTIPTFGGVRLDQQLHRSIGEIRVTGLLGGGLAAVALLLSAIGLYGTVAYVVRRRTRDLGVRMALGASRRRVALEVVGHGLLRVLAGAGIGVALALIAGRAIGSALYGVDPLDLTTFATVLGILVGVSLLALFLPARRAANVDPIDALRVE